MSTYWTTWVATLIFFAAFYALLVPLPLYLAGAGLRDWQVALVRGARRAAAGFAACGLLLVRAVSVRKCRAIDRSVMI